MTAPLLENHPQFHSANAEAVQAFLDIVRFKFDPAIGEKVPLDMRINGVSLPGMYIGYLQFGKAGTTWAPPARNTDYWFVLPVHGSLETTVHKDVVDCDPRRGVLSHPSRTGHLLRAQTGCGRLTIMLTESAVRCQLSALLGAPFGPSPDFTPAIDVVEGYGRTFGGYLRLAIDDFEHGSSMLSSPLLMRQFEDLVFTTLLLSHPHSYTQSLRRLATFVASRDVKRAIDYMEANLTSPIGLAEIATAAGGPGRTLLDHFNRYRGLSPMGYLRGARFARVREALRYAEPEEDVTGIAMSLGFTHMGRFSVEYRKRFGESPSETLKQRRGVPPATDTPFRWPERTEERVCRRC